MRTAALACLAAALAAADAGQGVRGPWWWHGADGAPRIGIAVAGSPLLPSAGELDGRTIALRAELRPLAGGGADGATAVLVIAAPAGSTGELRLTVGTRQLAVRLAAPAPPDAPARVLLAGGHAWPDRAAFAAVTAALGGPPRLVLALGGGVPARLGTGGWEDAVPVAVVAPEEPDLAASTGGEDARWRHGLRCGLLGLPASPDRGRADLAMARDLSPWLVYLDVPAGWDPACGVRTAADPRAIAGTIAAAGRLAVPLVLGAGRAGAVSEPLAVDAAGVLGSAPGGVRYVLPLPAPEDALARYDDETALPLEPGAAVALAADLGRLTLLLVRGDGAPPLPLAWTRGDADAGPAEGRGDASALLRQATAAESLATPAAADLLARWCWLPRSGLASALPEAALLLRLRDEGGPLGRTLVRRLALVMAEDPTVALPEGLIDAASARDAILWRLAHVRGGDAAAWRRSAALSPDPLVLRALLADLARDARRELLPALVERVAAQAAGTLPLDPDPLDQHRLFSVVFDDVRTSPTPLRPLAVALRERADPLARGPLERFLARHGTVRPP